MATTTPRFYRGDLPPKDADVQRVRRALRHGPATRQQLFERSGLTQNRALCAVDALIAAGEASFDPETKSFLTPST